MVIPLSLKAFIALRYKQAGRLAFGLGSYAILLVIGFFALLYYTYFLQYDASATLGIIVVSVLVLLNVHFTRKDLCFLVHHIQDYKIILFAEYALLLLPFVLTSLAGKHTHYWLLPLALSGILPFFQPKLRLGTAKTWLAFIPESLFEWRSGLRKIYWPAMALYLAAWAGVKVPYLSLLLLWLLTTLCLSFYDYNESVLMLTDRGGTARSFLHNKLKLHLQWVMIFFLPIVVLHLYFNPENAWIILAMVPGIGVLWIFGILAKYSHYLPEHQWFRQSNFTAVISLMAILPFAFVMPAGFAIYYYFKALKNLKGYFHD